MDKRSEILLKAKISAVFDVVFAVGSVIKNLVILAATTCGLYLCIKILVAIC